MRIENCKECYYNDNNECKRNPPTVIHKEVFNVRKRISTYPRVTANDWCGEFKHYKEKINMKEPNSQEEIDELLSLSFGDVKV